MQSTCHDAIDDYRANRSVHTLRAQGGDLANFTAFLQEAGIDNPPRGGQLQGNPTAWKGITQGLVLAYREWLMAQGYAIATVNRRLASVRVYARLASESLGSDGDQIAKIYGICGFGHKDGRNRDARRAENGIPTRIGAKKPYKAVTLDATQANHLKTRPSTPQGRRDALLMCLLLDHGLRCGEVAALEVSAFDVDAGTMNFYRQRVDERRTHRLTDDTLLALRAWVESGNAPKHGPILRSSRKGGALTAPGMSERAIYQRVCELGRAISIDNVSPQRCRDYWATRATRLGTHPRALQQAGGWNSLVMVMRYMDECEVANDGVIL